MNKIIFTFIILISGMDLSSQELHVYKRELIGVLKIGRESGQVGVSRVPGGLVQPSRIALFQDKFYIMDPSNGRLNIYNKNLALIKDIDLRGINILSARDFRFFGNGDMIGVDGGFLTRINQKGDIIFKTDAMKWPSDLYYGDFWLWKDYFIYVSEYGKIDYKIIDKAGRLLSGSEFLKVKKEIIQSNKIMSYSPVLAGKISSFLAENDLILANDVLLAFDSSLFKKYFEIIFYELSLDKEKVIFNKINDKYGTEPYNTCNGYTVWSYHETGEIYPARSFIVSPLGEIIDQYVTDPKDCGNIFPDGNMYWMLGEHDGFHVYGIRNKWKIAGSYLSASDEDMPYLLELRASSFLTEIFDKNAYHPVKVLDNDIKTMWIEGKDGPGIGESIYMGFEKDFTIDEIEFWPGCFYNAEYWKKNYRLKRILLTLGNNEYNIEFEDKMQSQRYKLDNPHTFHSLIVKIKEVYPTGYWEDTALSEIKLYYQGKEIKINTVLYENFLLKDPVALLKKGIEYLVSGIKYFFAAAENYKAG